MVNVITKIANLVFFLSFTTQLSASTIPKLKLELNQFEVELGESIESTLYGIDLPREILISDLQTLRANFGVKADESVTYISDKRWPGKSIQALHFQLFPRTTGILNIEQLKIGDHYSLSQSVIVKQARIRGKSIKLRTNVSTINPWERQQVLFEVVISTPDLFATLLMENIVKTPGFEMVKLPATRQRITAADGDKSSVLRIGWAIFPLLPGEHSITLPAIQYKLSGRIQRTYFLPSLGLNVRALPPYVPPTMPVANVDISSSINAPFLLNTNSLFYWKISLKSTALMPYWLPPVLQQIKSSDQVNVVQIDSKRTMQPNMSGVNGQVIYHVPFKPNRSGLLNLPDLRLQTFDANSGRLITVTHFGQRFFVLSTVWRWVLSSVVVLLLYWLTTHLAKRWNNMRQRNIKHKYALQKLQHAQNTDALRAAIKLLGEAEGLPLNLSLSKWAQSYGDNIDPQFEQLLTRISECCYAKNKECNIIEIRSELLSLVR